MFRPPLPVVVSVLAAPGPVAIDLASQRSNRYFGDFAREKDGRVTIDLKTTQVAPKPDEKFGYFSYKRLGTLTNLTHVLQTWSNEGGSGSSRLAIATLGR